jgi:membrane dipeptidase
LAVSAGPHPADGGRRDLAHRTRDKVVGEDYVGIGTDSPVRAIDRADAGVRTTESRKDPMDERGRDLAKERPDDLYTFIPDLNVPNRFEVLGAMLAERGHPEGRIAKILRGNFARVIGEVWG